MFHVERRILDLEPPSWAAHRLRAARRDANFVALRRCATGPRRHRAERGGGGERGARPDSLVTRGDRGVRLALLVLCFAARCSRARLRATAPPRLLADLSNTRHAIRLELDDGTRHEEMAAALCVCARCHCGARARVRRDRGGCPRACCARSRCAGAPSCRRVCVCRERGRAARQRRDAMTSRCRAAGDGRRRCTSGRRRRRAAGARRGARTRTRAGGCRARRSRDGGARGGDVRARRVGRITPLDVVQRADDADARALQVGAVPAAPAERDVRRARRRVRAPPRAVPRAAARRRALDEGLLRQALPDHVVLRRRLRPPQYVSSLRVAAGRRAVAARVVRPRRRPEGARHQEHLGGLRVVRREAIGRGVNRPGAPRDARRRRGGGGEGAVPARRALLPDRHEDDQGVLPPRLPRAGPSDGGDRAPVPHRIRLQGERRV